MKLKQLFRRKNDCKIILLWEYIFAELQSFGENAVWHSKYL